MASNILRRPTPVPPNVEIAESLTQLLSPRLMFVLLQNDLLVTKREGLSG